jgi:LPS-assembly protein
MTSRIRIFITAVAWSHLLLLPLLVHAQVPASAATTQVQAVPASAGFAQGEEVTIKAREQEKQGNIYTLRGDVEIDFRTYVLRADEIIYNAETGGVEANGSVVLDGGPHDEHITANHATYNVKTDDGKFYDVLGSIGTKVRGRSVMLTSPNPFLFHAREVEKSGRDRIIVIGGSVTTCALPHPKWTFNAEKIDVVVGQDAKMYHANFRIFTLPIFYFPYSTYPVDNLGPRSGFLIPQLGQSSRKGFILGESYYWSINRSTDTTIGAEYWSQRGWAQHGNFRARPSQNSYIDFRYYGVLDRGDPNTHQDQGGEDASLDAEFQMPHGVRAVANLNYLSRFIFRLAFSETFTQAVNSEVKSDAFLSKNYKGYSFDLMASRYQNFQSTQPGDEIKIIHVPSFETSSVEQRVWGSRIMFSYDVAAEGVSRREPDFVTNNLLGRFDIHPKVAIPMVLKGWSIRPEFGLWDTAYTQQLQPELGTVGIPIDKALNRRALESSFEVRPPALSRVFNREILGRKLKHVIEPRITYRYVTGVENFPNIIRFDSRDILSDTNEVEVGVIQRLYARRQMPKREVPCEPESATKERQEMVGPLPGTVAVPPKCEDEGISRREIVTWEVKAKYFADPTFGGALIPGRRNVFWTTAEYAGIAFLTDPRRWAPVVSKLRVQTSANTDVQWELDYDTKAGRINASTAIVNYRIGEVFIGGSQAFLQAPGEVITTPTPVPAPVKFNQFRVLIGYGHPNKRGLSAGATIGFDSNFHFLQYGASQMTYNWDCCGLSVEYRRFALGSVRNENQFRFAFTLANIGTFGNLRRQERLF